MDEVIQYRKDQKAGGGRLVYKGVKLNNRTMHNFRPTIGNNEYLAMQWAVTSSLTELEGKSGNSRNKIVIFYLQVSLCPLITSASLPAWPE